MTKQLTTDVNDFPTGFYETTINTNIPVEAIDISDAQWQEFIANPGTRKWNASTSAVDVYVPIIPLDDTKSTKTEEINQAHITELELGFVCVVNTIKMNTTSQDIDLLQAGYTYSVELSESTMDIRDFNNVVTTAVAIADVATMLSELKAHFRTQLYKKWNLQSQITAAVDEAGVTTVVW